MMYKISTTAGVSAESKWEIRPQKVSPTPLPSIGSPSEIMLLLDLFLFTQLFSVPPVCPCRSKPARGSKSLAAMPPTISPFRTRLRLHCQRDAARIDVERFFPGFTRQRSLGRQARAVADFGPRQHRVLCADCDPLPERLSPQVRLATQAAAASLNSGIPLNAFSAPLRPGATLSALDSCPLYLCTDTIPSRACRLARTPGAHCARSDCVAHTHL
eukprot:4075402-Pleurochrysis_carterae.AAC.2